MVVGIPGREVGIPDKIGGIPHVVVGIPGREVRVLDIIGGIPFMVVGIPGGKVGIPGQGNTGGILDKIGRISNIASILDDKNGIEQFTKARIPK